MIHSHNDNPCFLYNTEYLFLARLNSVRERYDFTFFKIESYFQYYLLNIISLLFSMPACYKVNYFMF